MKKMVYTYVIVVGDVYLPPMNWWSGMQMYTGISMF